MATPNRKKAAQSKSKDSHSLISDEKLRCMYAAMLGCRSLAERALREGHNRRSLRKQPVAEPTKPVLGQEAVVVGTTIDLRPDDTITAPGSEVVLRRGQKNAVGKTRQAQQALEESRWNVTALAASNGAQLTIGAGIALGNKDLGLQRVTVAFGDADPESVGSWREALHLAGLHQLPILFVLRATHSERGRKKHASLLALISEQAKLAGVMTIPVDETDVIAIYRVSFESIARARKGTGATLIVSMPYRVESSRNKSETKNNSEDPIERLETYLISKNLFSTKWKAGLGGRV